MIDAMDEEYEAIELFGQKALFTNSRIDRTTVPKGVYCYDIRHGDDDAVPCTLEPYVFVNHMGTVICGADFGLTRNAYIPMSADDLGFEGYSEDLNSYMKVWEKTAVPFPILIQHTPYAPSIPPGPRKDEPEDEPEL